MLLIVLILITLGFILYFINNKKKHDSNNFLTNNVGKKCFNFEKNNVSIKSNKNLMSEIDHIYPYLIKVDKPFSLKFETNINFKNRHIKGLYNIHNNEIVVKNSYIFPHEYGHFLDYNFDHSPETLSQQEQFKTILFLYRQALEYAVTKNIIDVSDDKIMTYLEKPSEIFARSYNYYVTVYKTKETLNNFIFNNGNNYEKIFSVSDRLNNTIIQYFISLEKEHED